MGPSKRRNATNSLLQMIAWLHSIEASSIKWLEAASTLFQTILNPLKAFSYILSQGSICFSTSCTGINLLKSPWWWSLNWRRLWHFWSGEQAFLFELKISQEKLNRIITFFNFNGKHIQLKFLSIFRLCVPHTLNTYFPNILFLETVLEMVF